MNSCPKIRRKTSHRIIDNTNKQTINHSETCVLHTPPFPSIIIHPSTLSSLWNSPCPVFPTSDFDGLSQREKKSLSPSSHPIMSAVEQMLKIQLPHGISAFTFTFEMKDLGPMVSALPLNHQYLSISSIQSIEISLP